MRPRKYRFVSPGFKRAHISHKAMMTRCYNSRHVSYKNYGGRGIKVCKDWRKSFTYFWIDMGPRPEGKWLDRKDNEIGYMSSNCRWATPKQQLRNRRQFFPYNPNGYVSK